MGVRVSSGSSEDVFSEDSDSNALRWLDWIFQKSYCSSLKINYDATSNVMVKQLPQLYYKKMKVCCDWCYVDIGVSIAR